MIFYILALEKSSEGENLPTATAKMKFLFQGAKNRTRLSPLANTIYSDIVL